MAFTRTIEDFTCENCGTAVSGSGYTNHCPHCLWSKHVDVQPGDRAESCGGMMEPVAIEGSTPDYVILHACKKCHLKRRNRTAANDSSVTVLDIVQKIANA